MPELISVGLLADSGTRFDKFPCTFSAIERGITATATVLAVIIGMLGGYLLARWQREKRQVRFVLTDNREDLDLFSVEIPNNEQARSPRHVGP